MFHRVLLCLFFGFAVLGCGTVMNVRDYYYHGSVHNQSTYKEGRNPAPRFIYGGVWTDACVGYAWWGDSKYEPHMALVAAYTWFVDLPLSTVGDTITLPVTVPATIQRRRTEASKDSEVVDSDELSEEAGRFGDSAKFSPTQQNQAP